MIALPCLRQHHEIAVGIAQPHEADRVAALERTGVEVAVLETHMLVLEPADDERQGRMACVGFILEELEAGALAMQREVGVPSSLVSVIQGLTMLFVLAALASTSRRTA